MDTLFLDTTYALPRHTFPPQAQAMAAIAAAMQEALATEPGTVCVMAAYHIGKERAIFSAARAAGLKVCRQGENYSGIGVMGLALKAADMI